MTRKSLARVGALLLALSLVTIVLGGEATSPDTRPRGAGDGSTALPGGCPPLGGGSDSFPATATLVIDDTGVGQPFVVRLSSAGHPDAVVQRTAQIGDTIATEIVSLELSGYHPRVGTVVLRQSPSQQSLGQIRNVVLDESCDLASGDAFFDAFLEIDVSNSAETWDHATPFQVRTRIDSLPEENAAFEVTTVQSIALQEKTTHQARGTLLYALYRLDPAFPPAGQDCFDTLLTADLHLFGPGTTSNLIGFGPTGVARGTPTAGGVCSINPIPCTSDLDCPLQTCLKPKVSTEIVDLGVGGFDIHLGDWQMSVLPERGDSDCCTVHPDPGCSDPVCESLICGMDDYCCNQTWDDLCSGLANNEPACVENCFDPDAAPSLGEVRSVQVSRTYPAVADFDAFFRVDTDLHGSLHNQNPIPLQPLAPVTNVPLDPNTEFRYSGAPVALYDATDHLTGEISNVVQTLQPPRDCLAPPPAGEDCFDSQVRLVWTLAPCPEETLVLPGLLRMIRDDAADGAGLGQELVGTLLAGGEFAATSACNGPVLLRLASATTGAVASLAPEEFFPASSTADVRVEIEVGGQTLDTAPFTLAASVDALPFAPSEVHLGPATSLDLLDAGSTPVGSIAALAHEIVAATACTEQFRSAIRFPGPTTDGIDVGIPGVGAGGSYDVVRGSLDALRAGAGDFGSAVCLETDVAPLVSDTDTPDPGDAFYYVARDGLGSFNGTWNAPGASQASDRDALLPDCVAP